MRAVIQRVSGASVVVDGGEPRSIGPGLVILLGVGEQDTLDVVRKVRYDSAFTFIYSNPGSTITLRIQIY